MSQRFSVADVAAHKTPSDLYIIVDEDVYDLTNFQEEHPGGKKSAFTTICSTLQANHPQSCSALRARTPPNSSGSTTTTAS
jgi:hypothetical protein